MRYLEYKVQTVPTGARTILYANWALALLLTAVACVGFLMLTSVAGGDAGRWAEPQMKRFALGLAVMMAVGMVPIWFWRNMAGLAYLGGLGLLLLVEFFGTVGKSTHAQLWTLKVGQNCDRAGKGFLQSADGLDGVGVVFVAAVAHIDAEGVSARLEQSA